MSLFDLARITESDEVPDLENTTVRNISIQFEVRPSLCEVDIPLIEARNDSGRGVLRLEVTQTRSQSNPVEGSVAVKLGNVTTRFFPHNDDIRRIKMIINEDLGNVTGELNVWSGRRSNDHAHQFCSGRNIFIRYDELTGRQPVFEGVSNLQRGQVRVVSVSERWGQIQSCIYLQIAVVFILPCDFTDVNDCKWLWVLLAISPFLIQYLGYFWLLAPS